LATLLQAGKRKAPLQRGEGIHLICLSGNIKYNPTKCQV
jgi:hypothetical protein